MACHETAIRWKYEYGPVVTLVERRIGALVAATPASWRLDELDPGGSEQGDRDG